MPTDSREIEVEHKARVALGDSPSKQALHRPEGFDIERRQTDHASEGAPERASSSTSSTSNPLGPGARGQYLPAQQAGKYDLGLTREARFRAAGSARRRRHRRDSSSVRDGAAWNLDCAAADGRSAKSANVCFFESDRRQRV